MGLATIASFNAENLFDRARALRGDGQKEILAAHAELNGLLRATTYTAAIRARILELIRALRLNSRGESEFAILRRHRGRLLSGDGRAVVANGRDDWIGDVELKTEPISEVAIENTARVISDVGADVLGVVEVESRPVLRDFNARMLDAVNGRYDHVMLIDGNDDRGIDVGVLCRNGWRIASMRSHVDARDEVGEVFSRDCAEYHLRRDDGVELALLVNHFKSKGFGSQEANDRKRRRQSRRVAEIYRGLQEEGIAHVAVVGDLNDTPGSSPMAPLLEETDLRDVTEHERFREDGRPGTFANGTRANKIDYVLLSPSLFASVRDGAIFRKGVWGGANGTLFEHYDTIRGPAEAASDHAAIYAVCDI